MRPIIRSKIRFVSKKRRKSDAFSVHTSVNRNHDSREHILQGDFAAIIIMVIRYISILQTAAADPGFHRQIRFLQTIVTQTSHP